jgi:hypothetical protein
MSIGKNAFTQLILPQFYTSLTLTSAQVLTIQTVPITIVSASPGSYLLPLWGWFEKPAGTAYVVNGQTAFGVYYGSQIYLYSGAGAGLFDSASATFRFVRGPGTVGNQLLGTAIDSTQATGLPLTITAATANMTTGNTTVRMSIIYQIVPASPPWS